MAFRTIWCVDVGKSSLKATQLRRDRGNVEILAIDKVDYTAGSDGFDAGQAKEALAIFLARNEIRDPMVVVHPGQGTFMRFIKIPAFDDKKLAEMVGYEAQQQIPFPLDEVIWDYHVVDREYLPGEERDVGLFAVRREAIDDFLLDFTSEGGTVDTLTVSYLALFNFAAYDLDAQEPSIVLDLGASHTDLILVDQERFWIRQLPHRAEDITRAMMQRFKLGFAEAERLKQQMGKNPQQAAKIFQAVIQPKLRDLVQEIQRSIGYYRSQAGEAKFERVYMFGGGSKLLGAKKFLQDNLGMPVERVASINHLRLSRDVNVKVLQADLPAFGPSLGGALQAVEIAPCMVDLIPGEEKLKKEVDRKKKHSFVAAGIVLVAILISGFSFIQKLNQAENLLSKAKADMGDALSVAGEVAQLEEEATTSIEEGIKFLKSVGRRRQFALEGIREFEKVFVELQSAPPLEKVAPAEDDAAKQAIIDEAIAGMSSQMWVTNLKLETILYPEDPEGAKKVRRSKERDKNKVPAYKYSAYAIIKSSGDQVADNETLELRFGTPLAKLLAHGRVRGEEDLTHVKTVTFAPGTNELAAIYVDDPWAEEIESIDKDEDPQEGGPFYGALATWFVLPDPPKGDETEVVEEEE